MKISMPELHPGVGACGRRPLRVRRPRLAGGLGVWVGGEGVPELEGIQAKLKLKAKARGGGW